LLPGGDKEAHTLPSQPASEPSIQSGATPPPAAGGGSGGKSVWDEEKEGKVIDLDDEQDTVARAPMAHHTPPHSDEWDADNIPKAKKPKKMAELPVDDDGAVDADSLTAEQGPSGGGGRQPEEEGKRGRIDRGKDGKKLEEEREKAIDKIEAEGEEVVTGKTREDGESWYAAAGRGWAGSAGSAGWALAAGLGCVFLLALTSMVVVWARARTGNARKDRRSFEEKFRMTAFDNDDL